MPDQVGASETCELFLLLPPPAPDFLATKLVEMGVATFLYSSLRLLVLSFRFRLGRWPTLDSPWFLLALRIARLIQKNSMVGLAQPARPSLRRPCEIGARNLSFARSGVLLQTERTGEGGGDFAFLLLLSSVRAR